MNVGELGVLTPKLDFWVWALLFLKVDDPGTVKPIPTDVIWYTQIHPLIAHPNTKPQCLDSAGTELEQDYMGSSHISLPREPF